MTLTGKVSSLQQRSAYDAAARAAAGAMIVVDDLRIDPRLRGEHRAPANAARTNARTYYRNAGDTTAATVGRVLLADGRPEALASYRHRVLSDLIRARRIVEAKAGRPVNAMVYPYGQYTPALVSLAHEAGYRYLFTTLGWSITPGANPSLLPRLDVGVWDATPSRVVSAILTVVRDARRDSYSPPPRYVPVWK